MPKEVITNAEKLNSSRSATEQDVGQPRIKPTHYSTFNSGTLDKKKPSPQLI